MDNRELIINFIENNLIIGRFPSEKDINDKYINKSNLNV